MEDLMIIVILAVILTAVIWYIVRSKKKGVKCIGCPEGCSCGKENGSSHGCGCGSDTQ